MITELKPDEIFVFGSNTSGRHGKGAAKDAMKWGAITGVGSGRQGQTYAIPTKDDGLYVLPLVIIKLHVKAFLNYAKRHPDLRFLVTAIGCGLAGLTPEQIAPMFYDSPPNVVLPEEFTKVLHLYRP